MVEPLSFEWFNDNAGFAQWLIFGVLLVSAIFIYGQMREQTNARKGANFSKIIELLQKETVRTSVNELYRFSKVSTGGKKILELADSKLPIKIKEHVIRVRDCYNMVGFMVYADMVDRLNFLILYGLETRDMWNFLKETTNLTINERNQGKAKPEKYFKEFEYIGKYSDFWRGLSRLERSLYLIFPILLPDPDSPFFAIRYHFMKNTKHKKQINHSKQ